MMSEEAMLATMEKRIVEMLGTHPNFSELRELGVEAKPCSWRIYCPELVLNLGEITLSGRVWNVFCYTHGGTISDIDVKSLPDAVKLLKWRHYCTCRVRVGLDGQPYWCECGAKEKIYGKRWL